MKSHQLNTGEATEEAEVEGSGSHMITCALCLTSRIFSGLKSPEVRKGDESPPRTVSSIAVILASLPIILNTTDDSYQGNGCFLSACAIAVRPALYVQGPDRVLSTGIILQQGDRGRAV